MRVGSDAAPATGKGRFSRTPGRRREVARRPLHAVCQEHGHKGPTARLMARHRGVFLTAPGSRFVGTVQFSPQASHFGPSARRPRLSGRERGTTWRAISLALRDCGKRRQAYPKASTNSMGDNAWPTAT